MAPLRKDAGFSMLELLVGVGILVMVFFIGSIAFTKGVFSRQAVQSSTGFMDVEGEIRAAIIANARAYGASCGSRAPLTRNLLPGALSVTESNVLTDFGPSGSDKARGARTRCQTTASRPRAGFPNDFYFCLRLDMLNRAGHPKTTVLGSRAGLVEVYGHFTDLQTGAPSTCAAFAAGSGAGATGGSVGATFYYALH